MSDRWTNLLSDYLDGDLTTPDRREFERHLETCDECRATLDQLRHVKEHARALVGPPAPDDLWAGIASRIGTAGSTSVREDHAGRRILVVPRRPTRQWSFTLAAAAALLVVAAGSLWLAARSKDAAPGSFATREGAPSESVQAASFDAVEVEGEIAQLQTALDKGRGKLDPGTVKVLEKNLALIRQATEDARKALAADPANRDLQQYFASTVHSKIELMRRATALAGA